jgi:hypothetical protein
MTQMFNEISVIVFDRPATHLEKQYQLLKVSTVREEVAAGTQMLEYTG